MGLIIKRMDQTELGDLFSADRSPLWHNPWGEVQHATPEKEFAKFRAG